ncbi:MAG: hypothetical protein NZM06_04695 [Chloroherpetonaceae bacterium]|nr:hypothetical protein [Chloroherpetonaceae bacterium]MDW8437819.1 hypothetical protein [Chloroherpetonaceae bacterium]
MKNLVFVLLVVAGVAAIGCGPNPEVVKMAKELDSLATKFNPSSDLGVDLDKWAGEAKAKLADIKKYVDSLQASKAADSVKAKAKAVLEGYEKMMADYDAMAKKHSQLLENEKKLAAEAAKKMSLDELKKAMETIKKERESMKSDVDNLVSSYNKATESYNALTQTLAAAAPASKKK